MTAQQSRWDDLGVTIPAGQAKYIVEEQPIAEYDNKHNYDVTVDVGVLFAFMNSYNANTILKADVDDTPIALTVGASTIVGRKAAGGIDALTGAEVRTIINVEDAADVTDATNVNASGAVMEEDFNAYTVLAADTDNTPVALTVDASRFVGRKAAGGIVAMTIAEAKTLLVIDAGTDIPAGVLPVVRGGTGVADDTYDADKVDGCDAGTYSGDVLKLSDYQKGTFFQYFSSNQVVCTEPGTSGYQLTTYGADTPLAWAASSDLIFSDTHCPKCDLEFRDGDVLVLYLIGKNEVGDILTIPMHKDCAEAPKKTVTIKRKVMEDQYILDELTGELKVQRVQKMQEKIVTKHKLKEGYVLDNNSGKALKINKDGKRGKIKYNLSDALETVEETVSEVEYENIEYEL